MRHCAVHPPAYVRAICFYFSGAEFGCRGEVTSYSTRAGVAWTRRQFRRWYMSPQVGNSYATLIMPGYNACILALSVLDRRGIFGSSEPASQCSSSPPTYRHIILRCFISRFSSIWERTGIRKRYSSRTSRVLKAARSMTGAYSPDLRHFILGAASLLGSLRF